MKFTLATLFVAAITMGAANAFTGDATFFEPGLGACGKHNKASDHIVALSNAHFNGGANCGKKIHVKHGGKSVEVKVVDLCPGCGPNDIDLSPSAFKKLAPLSVGRLHGVDWNFN